MPLVRLVYGSRSVGGPTLAEITDMLRRARTNNQQLGVTGALVFDSHFFLQVLEGERRAVNNLYNRIVADRRHEDVTLLSYGEIETRAFGDWAMGYVSHVDEAILARFAPDGGFDPFAIAPADLLPLMVELAEHKTTRTEAGH